MENRKTYTQLTRLTDSMSHNKNISLAEFTTIEDIAHHKLPERLAIGIHVLIKMLSKEKTSHKHIDRTLLDFLIAKLDEIIGKQIDEILHKEIFQQYEATWRSLKYLVDQTDFSSNIKVEILDVSKEGVLNDFTDAANFTETILYDHVYTQEYDTPGGEPISAIIADYQFDSSTQDINLLGEIAKVSASAHCPFIAAAGHKFFNKKSIDEVSSIKDLTNYMEKAEFIEWNNLRTKEESRYLGLTLPKFILRLPYSGQSYTNSFYYKEQVTGKTSDKYLWGNSNFALAANIAQSFQKHGWSLNIRGPESGGKITQLPLYQYDIGRGLQTKIPTETVIPETRELEYASLGFIPLSYYKNSNFACFFSANSVQKPQEFLSHNATANSRINTRLPYIFLCSRLGHYLKVLQRENIGTNKNRAELEDELNSWLHTLITKMNNPDPELVATHPLRDGRIIVENIENNPGFYRVSMYVVPHFQIEGIDVRLTLAGNLPTGNNKQ